MKQKNKIGINAVLNVIRQSLSIVLSLVTCPYILRVLGVEVVGGINYSESILSYFSLIAMLGVTNYAIREGARFREDRERFNFFASQIFSTNVLSTVLAYALLALACLFIEKLRPYRAILAIQSVSMLTATMGIDWVNTIYEDFLYITVRSIVLSLLSLVLIFVLVKGPEDALLYLSISAATGLITCVLNWIYCRRYVCLRFTLRLDLKRHMRPILILFANAVAVSVYVNVDTTMLGWFQGDYSVGIYSAAAKVYFVAKKLMVAVFAVALPRLSLHAGRKDWGMYRKTCTELWGSLSSLLLPMCVGMICLSDEIIAFLGGSDYAPASGVLIILSLALIFTIFGSLLTSCMNITIGKEKNTLMATVLSAAINFLLNFFFIPRLSYVGTAITTLISEAFVFWYSLRGLERRDELCDFKSVGKTVRNSLLGCGLIALVTLLYKACFVNAYSRLIGVTVLSAVAYGLFMLWRKDPYFAILLQPVLKKLKRT